MWEFFGKGTMVSKCKQAGTVELIQLLVVDPGEDHQAGLHSSSAHVLGFHLVQLPFGGCPLEE